MARSFLDALGLFSVPFIAYALLLALRQRYPFVAESWSRGSLAVLTVLGLSLVVIGILLLGTFADRHQGAWIPAHLDHGRLVPGQFQ